ncbi:MAG: Hypothetical protein AJITA_00444 [Acetilactobacillus jinshanensis]
MMGYVNCKGCRRQYLLEHFDQKFNKHGPKCCDFKNPFNLKRLGLFVDHHNQGSLINFDWHSTLDRLFNVK